MDSPDTIDRVIQQLAALGVEVRPGSRIDRMRKPFFLANGEKRGVVPADDPRFENALEAVKDVHHFKFILDVLAKDQAFADLPIRLQRMLKDSVLPQQDRRQSKGRDMQCELYVAAVCGKAGMHPAFVEPDLRCDMDGTRVSIAVKRIKNLQNLGQRISEAADQVRSSNIPGVIVADVSLALNPENRRIRRVVEAAELVDHWDRLMKQVVRERRTEILDGVRGKWVRGLVLLDHRVRLAKSAHWSLESMTFTVLLEQYNRRRQKEFEEFVRRFESGLATPPIRIDV